MNTHPRNPTPHVESMVDLCWNWMLAMSWQVAALVVILTGLTWLLRNRTSARFRYALWLLVPVRLVLPPTLALATGWGWWCLPAQTTLPELATSPTDPLPASATLASPEWPLPMRQSPAATPPEPTPFADPGGAGTLAMRRGPESRPRMGTPQSQDFQATDDMFDSPTAVSDTLLANMAAGSVKALDNHGSAGKWKLLLSGIWLAGILVCLGRIWWGFFLVHRLVRDSKPTTDAVQSIAEQCRSRVGLPRAIAVLTSPVISTPMLVGVTRPVVLLPERIGQHLAPGELGTVLVHEFQHVLRRDLVINFLTSLLVAVYWFHPAVWWAQWQLRRLRELACDEGTVAALVGARKDYAMGLVKVAEMVGGPRPTAAISFLERKSEMNTRVMKILDTRLRTGRQLSASALTLVLGLGLILLPGAGRPLDSAAAGALTETDSAVSDGAADTRSFANTPTNTPTRTPSLRSAADNVANSQPLNTAHDAAESDSPGNDGRRTSGRRPGTEGESRG